MQYLIYDFRMARAIGIDDIAYKLCEVIAFYGDHPETKYTGYSTLNAEQYAYLLNCSTRSVQRSLAAAREAGFIETVARTVFSKITPKYHALKHEITASKEVRQIGAQTANLADIKYSIVKKIYKKDEEPNYLSLKLAEMAAHHQENFNRIQMKHNHAFTPEKFNLALESFFQKINLKGYGPHIEIHKLPAMLDRYLTNIQLNRQDVKKNSSAPRARQHRSATDTDYMSDPNAY
jgi:hypothetical protein